MLKDLAEKTALIAGGANGIGLALAHRLVASDMNVVIADSDVTALHEAGKVLGARAMTQEVDVADPEAMAHLADVVFERFGTLELLCNNAGIASRGDVWNLSIEDWDKMIGVNLRGVINGIHFFVPRMLDQSEGHVVNTVSVAGIVTFGGSTPYATTKGALLRLSEGLWHELRARGSSVGVTALLPAKVATEIHAHSRRAGMPWGTLPDGSPDENQVAMGAVMQPDEVAAIVVAAVENDTFYAFTHWTDAWLETYRANFNAMIDGHSPTTVRPPVV